MSWILRSYLKYARGEGGSPVWGFLWPCQFVTRAWMRLRIGFYKRGIFSVADPVLPVVSIGNNCFGGTNKTPMAEYVVRQFAEAGIKAGLVSRGYRTKEHPPLWIGQDKKSTRRDFAGDEPLMLSRRLPDTKVVVSRKRIEGVKLCSPLSARRSPSPTTPSSTGRWGATWTSSSSTRHVPSATGRSYRQARCASRCRPSAAPTSSCADIIVLTKANQAKAGAIEEIKEKISPYVTEDRIFVADIKLESWIAREAGGGERTVEEEGFVPKGKYIALSAIGNPGGFYQFLDELGVAVAERRTYRDHHILTENEIAELEKLAAEIGADGFVCTEKDLANMPRKLSLNLPLYVPCIKVALRDPLGFRRKILEKLRPSFLVASNGNGEDAIGVVLAKKLKARFPCANVDAFALVGSGKPYKMNGINVVSPPADMPSGGVVKYHLRDLVGDMRHGLGGAIKSQMKKMRELCGKYRTPVCVGDVYLLLSVLWGQGMKPLFVATAKSVHLTGHMRIEKWLMRRRCILVWTRDEETARELVDRGVPAVFQGNPIMDLLDETNEPAFAWNGKGFKILLLPGSRPRAYDDIKLVLDTVTLLASKMECCFVMVPAPTIDLKKMTENLDGWTLSEDGGTLRSAAAEVTICRAPVAAAAYGAELLVGLGGTANQLCAGLGVPVVSIIERGKLRQKKLLREAEVLVPAEPAELAAAAERILTNPELRRSMQEAGIKNLGRMGALDNVVDYCAAELGWEARCRVYEKYKKYLDSLGE